MKRIIITLTIGLTLMLFVNAAFAQVSPMYGGQVNGAFGPRTIGQPFSGSQMPGMFGPRTIGRFIAPQPSGFSGYTQPAPAYYNTPYAGQPSMNQIGRLNQSIVAGQMFPEAPMPLDQVPPVFLPDAYAYDGVFGFNEAYYPGEYFGLPTNAGAPNAQNFLPPSQVRMNAGNTSTAKPHPFVLSQQLSNRLTNIARSKGMLSGNSISVYTSNGTARLQGNVNKDSDRVALGYVMSLEPGITRIDNRLAVK